MAHVTRAMVHSVVDVYSRCAAPLALANALICTTPARSRRRVGTAPRAASQTARAAWPACRPRRPQPFRWWCPSPSPSRITRSSTPFPTNLPRSHQLPLQLTRRPRRLPRRRRQAQPHRRPRRHPRRRRQAQPHRRPRRLPRRRRQAQPHRRPRRHPRRRHQAHPHRRPRRHPRRRRQAQRARPLPRAASYMTKKGSALMQDAFGSSTVTSHAPTLLQRRHCSTRRNPRFRRGAPPRPLARERYLSKEREQAHTAHTPFESPSKYTAHQ